MINKLNIDRQTLQELEIINSDDRRISVFSVLNKTATTGGKDKLRKIFLNPEYDIETIRERQEAVSYITSNSIGWKFQFPKKLMDQLEFYYFLNIDPVVSKYDFVNFFEGLRYWTLYNSYYKTFREGVKNVFKFFRVLNSFYFRNKSDTMPALLQKIFIELENVLNIGFVKEILEKGEKGGPDFIEVFSMDRDFRKGFKEEMAIIIDKVYELDVLISMAKATQEYNLVFPEFIENENAHVDIKALRHIFVKDCKPNDFLMKDGNFFMFLTGPNMAGKTTYLKAAGVALFLAHLGFGVPAESMKLTSFNNLYSSINTTDNLDKGYSYFYSEVLRVKDAALLLKKHKRSFMIFDELFRGTNVKDAFDGSLLVIKGLLNWPGSVFLLSSHLLELAKEVSKLEGLQFNYFDSDVINGKPKFNFELKPGVSDERLGLLILKNEKVDELLNPGE
jgi:DNA mismatch repair ATPase MutS